MKKFRSITVTPLHDAAKSGDVNKVRQLMEQGKYDVNCTDSKGCTPLHHACVKGNLNMVRMLVSEFQADTSIQNDGKNTPLHIAAVNSQEEVALTLINEFGCDPSMKGFKGWSLLHCACQGGSASLVRTLIQKHNADINAKNNDNDLPLHIAAKLGQEVAALVLINEFGCDPSMKGFEDWSLLHSACQGGSASLVRTLIQEHYADVNAKNNDNDLPLNIAADYGQKQVVLVLINEFGCDPSMKGFKGWSLLHSACKGGNVSLVRTLIREHNADVTAKNNDNNLPLHIAADYGQKQVALALINEFGCDPSMKGFNGWSLLHSACKGGNVSLVRTLIREHNADVNAKNSKNDLPLHIAANYGQEKAALVLINEFGCDPSMKGFKGWSLLHCACQGGSASLVQTLIREHHADVNAKNNDNDLPLHIAAYYGQQEVALTLINEFGCDPSTKDFINRSLLHSACQGGSFGLARTLIQEHKYSILSMSSDGDTALHVCAASSHTKCVEVLLHLGAPVMIRNKAGKTPMEVASMKNRLLLDKYIEEKRDEIYHHYDAIAVISKKEYSLPQRILRIFVVGNPGAGKSSLIEAMKIDRFLYSIWSVIGAFVPPHTAGIIPSTHHLKRLGRVLFYDFAGDPEYYSSHAAILEQLASSKKGDNIFIIVVDLRDDDETIKSAFHYWVSFIRHQNFSPFIIFVGSHSDQITNKEHKCKNLHASIQPMELQNCAIFTLNCCKPQTEEIISLQTEIRNLIKRSPRYQLSLEASILLGLLKKDFKNAVVCTLGNLIHHIMVTHICLPTDYNGLRPFLCELHELGLLLMIERQESIQIVLNTSVLCNIVHQLLFSLEGRRRIQDASKNVPCLKMGIISKNVLYQCLPEYITVECLLQLQYCQEIYYKAATTFTSLTSSGPTDQTFLFFPALISSSKSESELSWITPPDNCYSVSWLVQCTEIDNFFPPRFLHVLLLRLVFRFSVSPDSEHRSMELYTDVPDSCSTQHIVTLADAPISASVHPQHASGTTDITSDTLPVSSSRTTSTPDLPSSTDQHPGVPNYFKRHCTMWKTGVHWLMEEGVECMVELVDGNKGVVLIVKGKEHRKTQCTAIFSKILSCVMEARTEFCHDIQPQLFVLQSTDESKYLSDDNKFSMAAVERVLAQPEQRAVINSVSGQNQMESTEVLLLHKLVRWYHNYPLDYIFVLHYLEDSLRNRNYPALSKIGVISHDELQKSLPNHVSTSSFIQHKYCQEISLNDIGIFPGLSVVQPSKLFLFFPALLSMEKSDLLWRTPPNFINSIGWLANSTTPFPPKFHDILLLRIAFRFTLVQNQASTLPSPHNYTSRCSMWRRGVYWFMKESGAECMVELVDRNRSVVVTTKCEQDMEEECMHAFSEVVRCVVGVISDICPSSEVSFFLLDSIEDSDFLDSSNHFALGEVEKFLTHSQDRKKALLSLTGKQFLQPEKLTCLYKLALWYKFFPLDRATVFKYLEDVVSELMKLGLHLDLSPSVLDEIEEDFSSNCDRRRREVVKRWMSSTHTPPCWWHLTKALREIEMGALAGKIERDHRDHIQLQENLLTEANKSCRPGPEFLQSFAAVVGRDWQSLALSLSPKERMEKEEYLSPQDHAYRILKRWALREDATYCQLYTALKAIPLFQYGIKL